MGLLLCFLPGHVCYWCQFWQSSLHMWLGLFLLQLSIFFLSSVHVVFWVLQDGFSFWPCLFASIWCSVCFWLLISIILLRFGKKFSYHFYLIRVSNYFDKYHDLKQLGDESKCFFLFSLLIAGHSPLRDSKAGTWTQ